jgi:Holliday junction resolvase RusA-like endonuclease
MTEQEEKYATKVVFDVMNELESATKENGSFNSAHEGYAVIEEEFDELKQEVFKKASRRDLDNMEKEAVQVAAMAMRFLIDIVYPLQEIAAKGDLEK